MFMISRAFTSNLKQNDEMNWRFYIFSSYPSFILHFDSFRIEIFLTINTNFVSRTIQSLWD